MNKIFVAYKRAGPSSNAFLSELKKKYRVKKAGYSGTLDPFARGVLIVALGQYTKLLRFLDKSPKIYRATLWLGASSLSLDNKNIQSVEKISPLALEILEKTKRALLGELEFTPPSFSAKRVAGRRAYAWAKRGQTPPLKPCKMRIFSAQILHYAHPFLHLELSMSEGGYVRSYCELFAKRLGISATLSSLERVAEGKFVYNGEKNLNVLECLNLKTNTLKDYSKLKNGTKISLDELGLQDEGAYVVECGEFFSIIEVKNQRVEYVLNKVAKC
ncbi:tRNA pseudouridine(55) synthase TruB [Campylobacter sp.]|uniref:tRNA pseudouridine(55) synthase TruB n=1 Tax=Campylobacter sp. TaxID=205 RepID=UPI0026DC553A|nr:tRNA pseudouridine(55) synthase TruB [Campylobacter sp.]MDO4673984.1 tRNA pseudouridine(55) synthase TruB [Campylobacter sp.]